MSKSGNTPYVKVYKNGKLANPITKTEPYLHQFQSPRGRRKFKRKNNKQPLSLRKKFSRLMLVEVINRILPSGQRQFVRFGFRRNPNSFLRLSI